MEVSVKETACWDTKLLETKQLIIKEWMAQRRNKENLIFVKALDFFVAFNNVPFWVFLNIPQNV